MLLRLSKVTLSHLEIIIKKYPVELEGVEIEISILGSVDAYYIDMDDVLMDFSDDFIEKWA